METNAHGLTMYRQRVRSALGPRSGECPLVRVGQPRGVLDDERHGAGPRASGSGRLDRGGRRGALVRPWPGQAARRGTNRLTSNQLRRLPALVQQPVLMVGWLTMRWLVRTFVASLLLVTFPAAASAQDEPVGDSAEQTVVYSCGVASEAANLFMVVTQIDPQPDCSTYVSQDFPAVLDQDALALTSGLQTLCVTRNETTEFRLLWSSFGIAPAATPSARQFAIQVFCSRARNFAADNGWDYIQPAS